MVTTPITRRTLLISSATLAACGRQKATAYPGYCFVANRGSRSLAVVDLRTFRLWRPVALDAPPTAVLPHPRRLPAVFALAADNGTVYEVDVASLAVSRRVRVGTRAVSMRVSPSGDALWVLQQDPAALVEVALDTMRTRRYLRLPLPPDDFDLSSDGHAAIASFNGNAILMASVDRPSIERTVSVESRPNVVRFLQKGAQVGAGSYAERSLTAIDSSNGHVMVRLPLPIEPRHFCLSPDEGQLFVTGPGKDVVVIVYPYQTEIGETMLAGHAPGAMAIGGQNDAYLLVLNPETNSVTALDIGYRKLAAVVQVGQGPREILITPDNQYALVLNEKSGDLAVIRLAALAARRFKSAPLFTMIPVGADPVSAAVVAL